MRDSWNWTRGEQLARAAFYLRDPLVTAASPARQMRIAALIENAPEFPMEEIADEMMLKMQGGLRGFVRDEELN